MKRLLSITCIILATLPTFSQNEIKVKINERSAGKNLLTQKEISAKEIVFPQRIHRVHADNQGGNLMIELRNYRSKKKKALHNSGHVAIYRPAEEAVKWSKKVEFMNNSFRQYDEYLLQTGPGGISMLNTETGNSNWSCKNTLYYVDPSLNTGVGYNYSAFSGLTKKLQGIELNSGLKLWERELLNDYGWNDVFALNDSTLLIASSGLHTFNIKTGKGWDYFLETGDKNYKGMIAANAAGLALGVLTGTFIVSTAPDIVRDVVSNILVDSTRIYIASQTKIACINHQGDAVWSVPFHKDMASKSYIFEADDRIYMINHGYAVMGYREISYGTPFIAAFDRESGNQIFLQTLDGKKEIIKSFKIDGDLLYLVSNQRIIRFLLPDGVVLFEKNIDVKTYGDPEFFIGNHVYIQSDSSFVSLPLSDPELHFLHSSLKKTLVLDDNFEVISEVPDEELYSYYMEHNGLRFISKKDQTWVLNDDGTTIAEIPGSYESFIMENKFYSIEEKSLIELNLEELNRD